MPESNVLFAGRFFMKRSRKEYLLISLIFTRLFVKIAVSP